MKKKQNKKLALLLFSISFLLWGVNGAFMKISFDNLPIEHFLFIRFAGAFIILLPLTYRLFKKISFAIWLRVIISSIIGISGFMALFGYGLQRTTALEAALIFLLGPIFMFLLSIEMLKEKFNSKILTGLIVALAGATLVIAAPLISGTNGVARGTFIGNLIVAFSVFISVLGTVLIKPALKKVPAMQITTIRFGIAALCFLPFVLNSPISLSSLQWTNELVFAVGFNILLGSVVAYTLYHWALNRISGEESSVLHYLDPLAGVLAAIFILGDQLTSVIVLGGALTIVGIYLSEAKPHFKQHHLHGHR
jgi:drug/metabolite transporter (DMT)-like permease